MGVKIGGGDDRLLSPTDTAASSLDSMPTNRSFGSPRIGVLARISERTAGAILQPQPPPWEN
jgi:hypothetical protein